MIVNANSIVQHKIQITNETKINVNVRTNSMACAEKITIGILVHVFVRTVGICIYSSNWEYEI